MKRMLCSVLCGVGLCVFPARAQTVAGDASGGQHPRASAPRDYPNLHAPELTAADLAALLDLSVVKGRLLGRDGLRISGYELFFRDFDGTLRSLGNRPIPYDYAQGIGGLRDGEILVSVEKVKGSAKNAVVITLIARNGLGHTLTKYPLDLGDNVGMQCAHNFRGKVGVTAEESVRNLVEVGDNVVFSFSRHDAGEEVQTAEVILRTYAEKP